MAHHVYILRCADGTLYVGSAQRLDERLKAHNDGRGAAHTFKCRRVRWSIPKHSTLTIGRLPVSDSSSTGATERKKRLSTGTWNGWSSSADAAP